MRKYTVLRQYCVPQHFYTQLMGILGNIKWPWLKNYLIKIFIDKYQVDLSEAVIEDYRAYPTFNEFFTRYLKPSARQFVSQENDIACPADGFISQLGDIDQETLFQAKGFYFNLTELLGGYRELSQPFIDGKFATIYLAPKNYHRVHMPLTGKLRETIYVPGKLFSVNQDTAAAVPHLFSRNERLICLFDTKIGPMAVILVGALIVGNIKTIWDETPRRKKISRQIYSGQEIKIGAEMGHFLVGSTVIVLFAKNRMHWNPTIKPEATVQVGQSLGHLFKTLGPK